MQTIQSAPPSGAPAGEQARRRDSRGAAVGALVALGLMAIVSAQGGYFPTSWGWASIVFAWILAVWLVASGRTDAGRADWIFLALLAALICWIGISYTWSANGAATVLEIQRALVLLGGSCVLLLLVPRSAVTRLVLGVLVAIGLVSVYALGTRLLPDRLGNYDPVAVYRLSTPIGYWNGLGILVVMGVLLGLGVAVNGASRAARMLAGAFLVVLPVTLFFTYSRASWVALGLGLVVLLALSQARLRLLATVAAVLPASATAVIFASQSSALTHQRASLAAAVEQGHRLSLLLGILAIAGALCVELVSIIAPRVTVPDSVRMALGAVMVAAVVVAAGGTVVRAGGPLSLAHRSYDAFAAPPPKMETSLNKRLFNVSSNGRVELWRFTLRTYRSEPALGIGAGSFERRWQANPGRTLKVRDAHSLYLETLAELGPIGLGLLLATLGVSLAVGIAARRHPFVPAALGGYAAFLVHAGVDWDWELSGVTLTAIVIGSVGLLSARSGRARTIGIPVRLAGTALVVTVGAFAAVGLLGNSALDRANDAIAAERYSAAVIPAARARRWMPWSSLPLIAQGEAELGLGDTKAAQAAFRRAIVLDDSEWRNWLDLALSTSGVTRAEAFARAHRLYPTSVEIAGAKDALEDATAG